ncbi:MAG TPA: glycosyltransferase, partial [Bryobacteraceae bacterium]|nr:glycosyltransferase [Bryobacteraceae bacterium]
MSWQGYFIQFVYWYEWWVLGYLFAINSIYFILMVVGLLELLRHRSTRRDPAQYEAMQFSNLMPPISVLAPAYNEAMTIRQSVRAMLQISYPEFEVVVINDGSKDRTLQELIDEFDLVPSARYHGGDLETEPVNAVYESRRKIPLVVIDKQNGGKADALNAGINASLYPLVCTVDSDSLLEPDALLQVAAPFVEDPRVIACGGLVRVANNCGIRNGRVIQTGLSKSWVVRFQVVEYLRAFLGGRIAFSSMNSLLIISGAFGVFSKKVVVGAGGYHTDTVGEDMELVTRMHEYALREKMEYRIVFLPDPVCWTEVPDKLEILRRQRNRWQRGTLETLWLHKGMFFRPSSGWLGMFALPYFALFEGLGPLVELTGYVITIVGLALGIFSWKMALLFFIAAVLYGMILSTAAVVLEEMTLKRYPELKNLFALIAAGILESLGFKQLLTVWRSMAFVDLFR